MIQKLREKRAKAVADARAVMDTAETETRDMSPEEATKFDALMAEVETIKGTIARMESLSGAEAEQAAPRGRIVRDMDTRSGVAFNSTDALRGWLLLGSDQTPTPAQMAAANAAGLTGRTLTFALGSESLRSQNDVSAWASRAQSHTAAAGGYTVPTDFQKELEVGLLTFGGMREAASVVRTTTGADLPWPTSDDTSNLGEILGENAEVSEQDLVFGTRTLKAYKYSSKMIRVPVELIQDSAVNLASEVGSRLGERIGRITNRHFTIGTGAGQPEGIVTGATLGVTGASATAVTFDELVNLEHSVDAAYRKDAVFMFADTTLREIKKMKDDQGRPLWLPGFTEGEPERILNYKFIINNDMAAMASNAKSILFGDAKKFKIRDVKDVTLIRLDERFAEFHQVAFLAFSRHDGLLLDAGTRPVKYFKNAA